MKKEVFVHIGYPRTATTLFQEKVFDHIEGVHFMGKTVEYYPNWLIGLHYYDDFEFERQVHSIRASFEGLLHPGYQNLLSSEAFTRPGGVIYNQATRLSRIVPEARIIITLRDPIELLYSFHRYLYKTYGYFLSLQDSLDLGRKPLVMFRRKAFYLPDFYFSETISRYESLFGKENILVLNIEKLQSNPENYIQQLLDFLGSPASAADLLPLLDEKVNDSWTDLSMPELRYENMKSFLSKTVGSFMIPPKEEVIPFLQEQEEQYEAWRPRLEAYFKGRTAGYYS